MKRNHEGGSEQGDAKRVKITLESHREEKDNVKMTNLTRNLTDETIVKKTNTNLKKKQNELLESSSKLKTFSEYLRKK